MEEVGGHQGSSGLLYEGTPEEVVKPADIGEVG
jgi:hypothetical protein